MQKAGLLLGLSLMGAGSAQAQSASPAVDCAYVAQFGYFNYHPECNVAATSQIVTGPAIRQMQAISEAVSLQANFGLGGGPLQASQGIRGIAAGANLPKWNVWASGNYNDVDLSKGAGNAINFSGNQRVATFGADYRLSPATTFGVSAAYDDGYVRPQNGNGLKVTNAGINVAPYFAYQLNKNYSIDGSVGLGWGSQRNSGGFALNHYDVDTERSFAGINLNSGHWYGNWQVAGKASVFYSHQHNDADTGTGLGASSKYLMQGRVGVQTGYWMGNGFMPYVGVTYVNDMARNQTFGVSLDKDGYVAGVGLNYFSKSGITGGVSYTSEFGRHDVTNNVFMANVNVRF
ncbi:MAG: autotransporter outer membrane beta-barrel domain-containing protein [Actinomycetota bacterium]